MFHVANERPHLLYSVLSQSSSSLLPDLANLTTLLRIDVERFSSRLLPYQLPPSCSMEPVCSESELHADMLARNASEIVRWVERKEFVKRINPVCILVTAHLRPFTL